MGVTAACDVIERVRERAGREKLTDTDQIYLAVKDEMTAMLSECRAQDGGDLQRNGSGPAIVLVVGANGVGKTTTIAKLAHMYKDQGKRVIMAAGDTFRAAAIDQLKIWGDRIDIDVVSHQPGADPGAVVYDSVQAATSRGHDVLIIDTAGRLHTQKDLMRELTKIRDVVARKIPNAPNEVLLVLDATTGQNAIAQAKMFTEAIGVTGIFLAKLDGTARGGIVIAIKDQLDIPVKFVGLGETPEDIAEFDPESFVEALFN